MSGKFRALVGMASVLVVLALGVGAWVKWRAPARTPEPPQEDPEARNAVALVLRENERDAGARVEDLGIAGLYAVSLASKKRHTEPTQCFVWGDHELACGLDSVSRMLRALGLLTRKDMTNEHWQRLVFFFANVRMYYPRDELASPACKTKRFAPRVTRSASGGVDVDVIAGRPDIGYDIVPYQVRVSIAADAKLSISEEAWCPEKPQ